MATSPLFGWEEPDDTDLVKDGAAAIRTLGNAIDTSMGDLLGGTSGQVLSKNSNTNMDFTWVTSDDANAIQNTIVDAKGDLISATGSDVPARLAVGSNGETLVANSAASSGLQYNANYAAGKNKLINGDCTINQRGFTSTTTSGTYGFDRQNFTTSVLDGTATYSAQTFTPGTAPVAGYEAKNFARIVTTGQTNSGTLTRYRNSVENVRTFAGETTTFSFWAKAATGTPKIAVELSQSFGSGGSPSANVNTYIAQVTLSTSWARYSVTVNVPSISGKTIGTTDNTSWAWCEMWLSAGSVYDSRTGSLGIQNNTFDMWGFQWEAGSVATAFNTATGTLQGELAACQRYLPSVPAGMTANSDLAIAYTNSATNFIAPIIFPVTPRVAPTGITISAASDFAYRSYTGGFSTGLTNLTFLTSTKIGATVYGEKTGAGFSNGLACTFGPLNTTAYILFTGCEL
jgi:hypothetical protein